MALLVVFELSCESLLLGCDRLAMLLGQGGQLGDKVLLLLPESSRMSQLKLGYFVSVPLLLSLELFSVPSVKSLKLISPLAQLSQEL